jgi:hypothetical protein
MCGGCDCARENREQPKEQKERALTGRKEEKLELSLQRNFV